MQSVQSRQSRRHWKVTSGSSAAKVSVALELDVASGGADWIVVSGACVSTRKERVAGEASAVPPASAAATETLC